MSRGRARCGLDKQFIHTACSTNRCAAPTDALLKWRTASIGPGLSVARQVRGGLTLSSQGGTPGPACGTPAREQCNGGDGAVSFRRTRGGDGVSGAAPKEGGTAPGRELQGRRSVRATRSLGRDLSVQRNSREMQRGRDERDRGKRMRVELGREGGREREREGGREDGERWSARARGAGEC